MLWLVCVCLCWSVRGTPKSKTAIFTVFRLAEEAVENIIQCANTYIPLAAFKNRKYALLLNFTAYNYYKGTRRYVFYLRAVLHILHDFSNA